MRGKETNGWHVIGWLLVIISFIVLFYYLDKYLEKIRAKAKELEDSISEELALLKVEIAMREAVILECNRRFRFIAYISLTLFLLSVCVMLLLGMSYIDALGSVMETIGAIGGLLVIMSVANNGANNVLERLKERIRRSVYKKHGYNPSAEKQLILGIKTKRQALRKLGYLINGRTQ